MGRTAACYITAKTPKACCHCWPFSQGLMAALQEMTIGLCAGIVRALYDYILLQALPPHRQQQQQGRHCIVALCTDTEESIECFIHGSQSHKAALWATTSSAKSAFRITARRPNSTPSMQSR